MTDSKRTSRAIFHRAIHVAPCVCPLILFPIVAVAQEATPVPAPTATPAPSIEPEETVISVVVQSNTTPRSGNSQTVVPGTVIERNPGPVTLNNVIAATVPGAAALPNGAIRIRGSDNQFSYYLDGAPLPANISSFVTDQINPKNIESLRVLTGAFPARYNGQLSAVFDIRAKGGRAGNPEGFLQGEAGNFSTRGGAVQYSNGVGRFGYFLSGFRSDTDFRLSPFTPTPFHNAGSENVGFGKFDYQLSAHDRLTFHFGAQAARLEVPNSPDREAVGQDDLQLEKRSYLNAIWRRDQEKQNWTIALYSHLSQNRYQGSPGDLIPSAEEDDEDSQDQDDEGGLISLNQRQRIRYSGARGDFSLASGANHRVQAGFNLQQGRGDLDFSLVSAPESGFDAVTDNRPLQSHDLGLYVQDDWKLSRFNLNYGVRYDHHRARDNGSFAQLSPRINLSYTSGQNTFYTFYNRLWMPVPVESIRLLEGESALGDLSLSRVLPETDDFFGVGWKGRSGKNTFTVDAYDKSIRNIVDNQEIGDTRLEVPINEARGRVRGIEFSLDRPLSKHLSLGATYGLSRGVASGPTTGGLLGLEGLPSGYFVDDHDITHIATANLAYNGRKTYALLNGRFSSGLPYGEEEDSNGDPTRINFLRAPSHFLINAGIGHHFADKFDVALNVTNLLDKEYVIAADNVFRRSVYGQRRAFTVKATYNF